MKKFILRFIAEAILNYAIIVLVLFLYDFVFPAETLHNNWLYALNITIALRIFEIIKLIYAKRKK